MASLFSSLMGGKVKQSAGAQLLERMSTATQVSRPRVPSLSHATRAASCRPLSVRRGVVRVCVAARGQAGGARRVQGPVDRGASAADREGRHVGATGAAAGQRHAAHARRARDAGQPDGRRDAQGHGGGGARRLRAQLRRLPHQRIQREPRARERRRRGRRPWNQPATPRAHPNPDPGHGTSQPHHPACARACRPEPRACPCQARRTTCTSSSTRCS